MQLISARFFKTLSVILIKSNFLYFCQLNIIEIINNMVYCFCSIKTLPPLAFENLNSLETLNLQNNKLTSLAEEPIEPILDTLRTIDVSGKKMFMSRYLFDKRGNETKLKRCLLKITRQFSVISLSLFDNSCENIFLRRC